MKYKHSTVGFLRKFLPLSVRDREKWWCAVCQMSSHPDTVCIATQLDRTPDGLVVLFYYAGFTANIYSAYNLRLLFDTIGGNAWRCMLRFNGVDSFETFFVWILGSFPQIKRLKRSFIGKLFMIIAVRVSLSLGSVNNILAIYGSIKGIPNEQNIDTAKWMGFTYFGPPAARNTCGRGDWMMSNKNLSLLWGCKPWPGRTLIAPQMADIEIWRAIVMITWVKAQGMSDIWRPLKAFVSCTLHLWEIRSVTLKWKSLHSGMTRDTTWPSTSQWDWRMTEWSFSEGCSHEAFHRERGNRPVQRRKIFFTGVNKSVILLGHSMKWIEFRFIFL